MNHRLAALLAIAVVLTSCVATGAPQPDDDLPARSSDIVIGAFNFSESQVLAELYEHALDEAGFEADVLSNVGPREIMGPAVEQGQIDIVIEYLGAATAFLEPEGLSDRLSRGDTFALLRRALEERGMQALTPAPGQNRNEIVVSATRAREDELRTITDLQSVDGELVFGGPPECPARPLCLEGLERRYQLDFARFQPLDTGGPLTSGALENGHVDVGLLFTTNPVLATERLVALEDDRHLQPPENITPIVREELVSTWGQGLVKAIDDLSARLTTDALRDLNAAVDLEHKTPEAAALEWLENEGLR